MKLFFEGSSYDKTYLSKCFGDIFPRISRRNSTGNLVMLDVVGYYFNKQHKDPYFILPKVFVQVSDSKTLLAFGKIPLQPDCAIDINIKDISSLLKNEGWKESIIYELPIWLYRAISKYKQKDEHRQIEQVESLQSLLTPKNEKGESTLLDIVLALEEYYKQNKDLLILTYKQVNSGFNKVNWSKVASKSVALVSGNTVVYPTVANHRKKVDYDEELLCLYYNTLRYISRKFDPELKVEVLYNLTPDELFARQAERGIICKQLRSIRGNYFNDKLQRLWSLLYAFHKRLDDMRGGRTYDDYLLIKDFNIVFEDMINELLSDVDVHPDLIEQRDGKILDHIFKYDSIISQPEQLYYVGDSKYYRDNTPPKGAALYKQFTYVKNIMQLHFDWYNQEERDKCIYRPYRDDKTEGYNISPNFFISANVTPTDTYKIARLLPDTTINEYLEGIPHWQYPNRLFDRDTLFLRQFNINFLFVLHSYVQQTKSKNKQFKSTAQEIFKDDFAKFLNGKYSFFKLVVPEGQDPELVLNQTFKKLIGKIYCPNEGINPIVFAIESNRDNTEILEYVDRYYHRESYSLGDNLL